MNLIRIVRPGKDEFSVGGKRWPPVPSDRMLVFMDKVAWDHEIGTARAGSTVHPSLESLREYSTHKVDECGIVEVEMNLVRIVQLGKDMEADAHSVSNRIQVLESTVCGCYRCLAIFPPSEITEWVHRGRTALCPKCGFESVIGSASGVPITTEFLSQLQKH